MYLYVVFFVRNSILYFCI